MRQSIYAERKGSINIELRLWEIRYSRYAKYIQWEHMKGVNKLSGSSSLSLLGKIAGYVFYQKLCSYASVVLLHESKFN